VPDAVGIHQRQAGGGLETLKRASFDLAAHEQKIELSQGVTRVVRFQIVFGPEEALAASLALSARDRAQRVETACDRAEEALFRLHIGRDRPEQRRLRLVRPVGAAEPLNGGIRLPARFEQIMDAKALVPCREFGMIATPGPAGVA